MNVWLIYFGIVCPLFIQWQSLKEPWLCAGLALPKQKKALSLCPWILGGKLLSPLNALPGKIVSVLLGMWPVCQYSMLTLQCVGGAATHTVSAGSLEGLGMEASQAHVHHGNSTQSHPQGSQ